MSNTKTPEQVARTAYVRAHGARVRRAKAMELLGVASTDVFKNVVAAHPELRHKLDGEGQTKYLTSVIFDLLPAAARCATAGEEN